MSGKLTSINALEYAIVLINCVTNTYYWVVLQKCLLQLLNPHPVVFINADNTTAESWTEKGLKIFSRENSG